MTRSTARDTFSWYGPERIAALKATPVTMEYADHLATLIVWVMAQ